MAGRPTSDEKAEMVGVYFPPADFAELEKLVSKEARSKSQMVLLMFREALMHRNHVVSK